MDNLKSDLTFKDVDEGWAAALLGDVVSFKVTNSYSREYLNYENGSLKNIHYGDIHTKFQTLFDIEKENVPFINPDVDINKIKDESYCREGDLILADASEDLADVGKSIEIVNLNNEKLVSGLHTILARPAKGLFPKGFLGYLFQSYFIRKQIQKESQGAKVLGISASRLQNLIIHYPLSIIHSTKIASCLSSLDDLITAHSQKLELLKDHKKGLMQNLFPQMSESLISTDEQMTQINSNSNKKISEIPKSEQIRGSDNVPKYRFKEFEKEGEWVEKKLGEMTIKVGSGVTPLGGEANYKSSGRPFVRSQNVSWGIFLLDNITFIDEPTHQNSINTEIQFEDVLLNITGASIGRSAVANEFVSGGNVNQHVCIIRTEKDILNPSFLNQFLISDFGQKQIDSFQAGGNRQGLNFVQIRSLSIPIPPTIQEQQKIASCLSSLDALITAQAEKIEQLKLHKKGLMQGLFPTVKTGHALSQQSALSQQ